MRRTITALGQGWTATAHLLVGAPLGLLTANLIHTACLFALVASAVSSIRRPVRNALFVVAHICSVMQSARFRWLLGEPITPAGPGNVAAGWRQVWYHFFVGINIALFGTTVLVSLWATALYSLLLPVFSTPDTSPFGLWSWDPLARTGMSVFAAVLMAAAVLLAPPLARLDVAAARAMMEASRTEELEQRVAELSHSRAEVVGAADAERRRIERDLHDGAQQRLVSLAMNLGLARAELSNVDPQVRRVIEHAHEEAKQALAELRALVRGLYPAVLHDRGLDAALSGIAARSPVPARITVELAARPSPTVEAVAYFVVAEALSNVAKHSRADSVDILVRGSQALVRIEIHDNGRGGADPSRGTGLRGLAQRVGSVDGTWHVSSPPGGPTVVTVELPVEPRCE
jgi:signal transduction histidine kinase